jgi:predicted DNA-binding transcriptional regulator YafY
VRRADRLYALVEHLRRRRTPTTAGALAARFDVTERTLWRDLAALRDQHVPIEGEPGRGGGIRLGEAYSMPPLSLTLEEATALWLSARVAARVGLGVSARLPAAVDKILGAIPKERRRALVRLAERVFVGNPVAAELAAAAGPVDERTLRACEDAFARHSCLAIRYVDRTGQTSARRIAPHGILVQPPLWYVLAVDVDKDVARMFRLDRMTRVAPTDVGFLPRDPRELFPELEGLAGARPLTA